MHVGGVLLHLLVLLLLLLRLRLVHTLMMVSLRGVQAGCTQQGSALPEQRCHLHPGCVLRVVGFTGSDLPSAGCVATSSLALSLLPYPDLDAPRRGRLFARRRKRRQFSLGQALDGPSAEESRT